MMPFGGTRMPRVVIRCTMEHGSNNWIIQCANVQSRTIPYNQILIPYNQILLSLQRFAFFTRQEQICRNVCSSRQIWRPQGKSPQAYISTSHHRATTRR